MPMHKFLLPKDANEKIQCASCHNEHEGRIVLAVNLSNKQCQICRKQYFEEFVDHPALTAYPHHANHMVNFDHGRHFRLHFPKRESQAPQRCADCHRPALSGNMLVSGFSTCAGCHENEIRGIKQGDRYLVFLEPPGLDLEALENVQIGAWPEYAEAELNEFLILMLEKGDYMDADTLTLVRDMDLLDLTEISDEEIQAVLSLVWAFKQLVYDLSERGPVVFVNMFKKSDGIEFKKTEKMWSDIAGALSPEILQETVRRWFPNPGDELIGRHEAGNMVVSASLSESGIDIVETPDLNQWPQFGGWQLNDLAIAYRPTGHADPFLKVWLTISDESTSSSRDLFDLLTHKKNTWALC